MTPAATWIAHFWFKVGYRGMPVIFGSLGYPGRSFAGLFTEARCPQVSNPQLTCRCCAKGVEYIAE
jgi:hypothetical protein